METCACCALKLFNKKCKYADCEWQGCDEEAERLQHYVKKHGDDHPEVTCQSCKTTFSQINKLNPFTTEPLANFLLLETDNLGVIH